MGEINLETLAYMTVVMGAALGISGLLCVALLGVLQVISLLKKEGKNKG